jgi:DNA polymerase-1
MAATIIIEQYRRTYSRFWEWREQRVEAAMIDRQMETVFGWPLHLSHSPNKRTLFNFPMQGNGAEMLRLAAWRMCEAGIVPSMLVHDGILFEVHDDEQIEHAKEIMRAAGRDVCDGFEIGVDIDQMVKNGARYQDKRKVAKQMWATIERTLQDIGALPKEQAA